jgi:pyruvate,orthophosphate dikinase
LFVHEVTKDDADALRAAAGIVTVRGGLTGEAAVMARALSKPCIASGSAMTLTESEVRGGGATIRPGDAITLDGKTGLIVAGFVPRKLGSLSPEVARVLALLPNENVLVRSRTAADVATAKNLGAGGVFLESDEQSVLEAAHRLALPVFAREPLSAALQTAAQQLNIQLRTLEVPAGPGRKDVAGFQVCEPDDTLSTRLAALATSGDEPA